MRVDSLTHDCPPPPAALRRRLNFALNLFIVVFVVALILAIITVGVAVVFPVLFFDAVHPFRLTAGGGKRGGSGGGRSEGGGGPSLPASADLSSRFPPPSAHWAARWLPAAFAASPSPLALLAHTAVTILFALYVIFNYAVAALACPGTSRHVPHGWRPPTRPIGVGEVGARPPSPLRLCVCEGGGGGRSYSTGVVLAASVG